MTICPVCQALHNGSHICDKPSPTDDDFKQALAAFKAEAFVKHPPVATYEPRPSELLHNGSPVCPWCGHPDADAYLELDELRDDGDEQTNECPKCDRDYEVTLSYVPEYSTRKP